MGQAWFGKPCNGKEWSLCLAKARPAAESRATERPVTARIGLTIGGHCSGGPGIAMECIGGSGTGLVLLQSHGTAMRGVPRR